jgi:surface carbohydrate biosynthesis protein (TIGR04326 family)
LDAYLAGLSVVVMLDENELNMSPLRGLKDIVYVTDPTELAEALRNVRQRKRMAVESYFWLDTKLPRWRQLLGLSPVDAE